MICNFKNICKSLAFQHQLQQCYYFSKCTDFSDHLEARNYSDEDFTEFPFLSIVKEKIGSASIFLATSAKLSNILYRSRYFLCYFDSTQVDDLPLFGRIMHIFVANSTEAFVVFEYGTCYFDERYRAYALASSPTVRRKCILHHKLHHILPHNLKRP